MNNEALIAAKKGNLEKLKELIVESKVNVNEQDDNGRTLLHVAVNSNQPKVVEYLLGNGADVLLTTEKGNTALHIAVLNKYDDMVRTILESVAGRDKLRKLLDMRTKATGTAALHVAAKNGYMNSTACLLEHGCNFQIKNNAGEMPVDHANGDGPRDLLRALEASFTHAKNGDDRLITDLARCTMKSSNDNIDILWIYLFNCRNNEGHTLMQELISRDHYKLVNELLDWAWHLHRIMVVWSFIVDQNKDETNRFVDLFREYREFWRQKSDAITALFSDLTEKRVGSKVKRQIKLSSEGAVVSVKLACEALKKAHEVFSTYRRLEIKRSSKTDPSMRTIEDVLEMLGFNPEEVLVIDGETDCYYEKLPLEYKDHIDRLLNLMNNAIDTPLSFILRYIYTFQVIDAAKGDDIGKVEYLVKNGASLQFTDRNGKTACCYAVERGNKKMIKLLLKSHTTIALDGKISPICLAIDNGDVKVVKRILKGVHPSEMAGFIDCREKSQSTALHAAARKGRLDIVKILLCHGATYLIYDENVQTPLDVSNSEEVSNFFKIIDECFQGAKEANDELVFKLKAMDNDEFMAVAGTRNNKGQTISVVAAAAGAKNVAAYILKMIKEIKQSQA